MICGEKSFGDHRGGATAYGVGNKLRAILLGARYREKNLSRSDAPGVVFQSGNLQLPVTENLRTRNRAKQILENHSNWTAKPADALDAFRLRIPRWRSCRVFLAPALSI